MPKYHYRCSSCKEDFEQSHSASTIFDTCTLCHSKTISKIVPTLRAKVHTSEQQRMEMFQEQMEKDQEKFLKDDNFATNITGQYDIYSNERRERAMQEQIKKNEHSLQHLKRKT